MKIRKAVWRWSREVLRTVGFCIFFLVLSQLGTVSGWAGAPIQITSISNPSVSLQINAYGGSYHGTTLKVVSNCPAGNTDCTWTLLSNGMIVSDSDPTLAWNAYGGAKHGTDITLVRGCQPNLTDCTWTVRDDGLIVSNTNPQLAVNAYGGAKHLAPLKLVNNCAPELDGCKWVGSPSAGWPTPGTSSMVYSGETSNAFAVNAYGGAKHGTELQVVEQCPVGNSDCLWRFRSDGMIISESSAALAWNAYGGAQVGTKITLVVGCPSNNTDCQWDRRPDGMIVSRTNPNLAVKAQGGPHDIAPLVLANDCTLAIPGCTWTTAPNVKKLNIYDLRSHWQNGRLEEAPNKPHFDPILNPPSIVLKRPFNIVAVGDSIMWGQGLSDQNKFVTMVAESLKKQLGKRDVIPHLLAHSGATTYPEIGKESEDRLTFSGEVPHDYPSIHYQVTQLAQTRVQLADVDLVLIDGCINNVNVRTIIWPLTNRDGLRMLTREYCGAGMQNLLTELSHTFPHAKVIVMGYYPIISKDSDPKEFADMLRKLGVGGIPFIIDEVIMQFYRDRAAELSAVFFEESRSALQLAIDHVNGTASETGRNRFRYVAPHFEGGNSYAGGFLCWLWLFPSPGRNEDEAFRARGEACAAAGKRIDPTCQGAAMGHPNGVGALAYANAITSAASFFIPEWLERFGLSKPVPVPEPVDGRRDDPSQVCPKGDAKCSLR